MPWPRKALCDLLGIAHPIIQAPMAGASTAALAAAVSNAGALGGFGGTDSSPDELRVVIRAIRGAFDDLATHFQIAVRIIRINHLERNSPVGLQVFVFLASDSGVENDVLAVVINPDRRHLR